VVLGKQVPVPFRQALQQPLAEGIHSDWSSLICRPMSIDRIVRWMSHIANKESTDSNI
jgi:hypothetical protein